jgi:hypothetical protein
VGKSATLQDLFLGGEVVWFVFDGELGEGFAQGEGA